VWERLVGEHGADVGSSTVRVYVNKVRDAQRVSVGEVMVRQFHELGVEAEVDFGVVHYRVDGELVEGALFVMRLSVSGRSFCGVYRSESQEAFLDGHVRGFTHFGGVPCLVRYDNLKAAVVKVLRGRNRVETDRFMLLRSHYGFDSFFCRPGIKGAHEKGGVEGEVGRVRRRYLVPVPKVSSLTALSELIVAGSLTDDDRVIANRKITVGEHFKQEAPLLSGLPVEVFEVGWRSNHRVDAKARVSVRGVRYSVPAGLVHCRVDALVGADTVELFNGS